MRDWRNTEAEAIVDAFVADQTSHDLLRLQQAIAAALRRAYEKGRKETSRMETFRPNIEE